MKRIRIVTSFKRSTKHLIKLILHENHIKLLKFKRRPVSQIELHWPFLKF